MYAKICLLKCYPAIYLEHERFPPHLFLSHFLSLSFSPSIFPLSLSMSVSSFLFPLMFPTPTFKESLVFILSLSLSPSLSLSLSFPVLLFHLLYKCSGMFFILVNICRKKSDSSLHQHKGNPINRFPNSGQIV